ncbi:hypothetical protein [Streptomyces sp. AA1529]|uniref:hypothetical protein n=1 Tax=Streptomyces sp. AA1529 TaxID=1203257 RepID=UPI003D731C54
MLSEDMTRALEEELTRAEDSIRFARQLPHHQLRRLHDDLAAHYPASLIDSGASLRQALAQLIDMHRPPRASGHTSPGPSIDPDDDDWDERTEHEADD